MKKYVEIMKKYEGNMKKYAPLYMGRGTWRNFRASSSTSGGDVIERGGVAISQFPGLGGTPERRHETYQ